MSTETSTLPSEYWERRAREFAAVGGGLAAVCSYGMPAFYNLYIECCQRRALKPWLARAPRENARALDVGCGVGRWSVELARRGYHVTGFDLSPYMIERARARAAARAVGGDFLVADVGSVELNGAFNLIVCVTVLQHLTEAERAAQAIGRLADHLARSGRLILLEAAPTRHCSRCDTAMFRARTLEWYRVALEQAGLELIAQRGVDPMPLKTWLLPHYRGLHPVLRTIALALTTAVSLPLDWMLGGWVPALSWHKVLVAQRAGCAGR